MAQNRYNYEDYQILMSKVQLSPLITKQFTSLTNF